MEIWQILTFALGFLAYAVIITVYVVNIKSDNKVLKSRVDAMEKWKEKHENDNKEAINKICDDIKTEFSETNKHIVRLNMLLAKNLNIDVSEIMNQ